MNGNLTEKILVVDDEPPVRKLLMDILLQEQYDVLVAENGTEAMRIFDGESVDLIITDIRMKETSGIELLKYIKENWTSAQRATL